MPEPWFAAHPQGDVLSRLFGDVRVVESGLSQAIGQGVFQLVSLITSAVIMLSLNLWLGLVVLVAAPLVGVVYRSMANGAMVRSVAVQEQSSALLSVAAENYRAIPVVKMFGLADRERRRFAQQSDRLFRSTRRLTMWGGLFGLSVNLIVTILRLGVLGFGSWLILEGEFTTGGLVAFLSIMGEVLSPVTVLVSLSQDVQASMGSLVRINEVIDEATEPEAPHLGPVPLITRELRLAALGMSYDTEHRALDDFDATIPVGSRVAVVGPSGSGKSTVLRLLMRLYEPDEGAILIDGVDLRSGSLRSWREQLRPCARTSHSAGLAPPMPRFRQPQPPRKSTVSSPPCHVDGTPWWVRAVRICPAVNARGLPSREPCCGTPGFSCWTRPPRPSTRPPSGRSTTHCVESLSAAP